ncbi:hypothetical protein EC52239_4700, partial [Escherichia coli 5.2239]|jgi:hypothetical protein
MARQ